MTRLWEEELKVNSSVLRLSTLERLGGAQKIVRMHLDGTMERLNGTEQEVCSRFFDRLVTPSGTKIACNIDDLTNWAGDLSEHVKPVLKTLSDDRILRSTSAPNDQREKLSYEIYHDVLAPAILDWRTRYIQEREKEETQKKAALEATQAARERMRRLITYGLSIGFLLAVVMMLGLWHQMLRVVLL